MILEQEKNDVNQSLQTFLTKINELLDKYMPLRKITKKEYKRKFKPWITDDIINKLDKKNATFRKYMKCKDQTKKDELNTNYKCQKNEITTLMRQSKKDYYNHYFSSNTKNLQNIWKGIKEIINIKTKTFSNPTCIMENNKTYTNPIDIANSFNRYYTSIADEILNKRKYGGINHHTDYLQNPLENTFAIFECDQIEIENIITSLNPRKAVGPNSIPTDILQILKNDISLPLMIIFNISISTGIHPDLLKIAKTIPIYKKGSKLATGNYRPISLLSNLNKILEKLMFNRIYKFLENKKCIYDLQFGFRSKHSTNHTLIQITENIRKALDNKQYACGIFIDLQKAFDTVNHHILLDKLNYYGIRGTGNNWFKSYLSNRSQYVSIQGFESDIKEINHGVPQGSVLGPLLFLLYINDLHVAIKNSSVYHFADDTNLLNINTSPKRMQNQVNYDLKCLYNWLLANKISLNCSKTELIFFHKPGHPIKNFKFKIKINGHKITPTDNLKYLGVYLDSTLSGKYHCDNLCNKLKRANGMLSKVRHYVPKDELKSIYHAIFSSHMIYGCQIWGQGWNKHIQMIQKLQNRAIRIINFREFNVNPNPLYKNDNILKIQDFVKLQNCLLIHDYLTNSLPNCFDNYFHKLDYIYLDVQTRNSNLGCIFSPIRNTTRYGINSITQKSISVWNSVTKTIKTDLSTTSRNKLKKIVTKYFLNQY